MCIELRKKDFTLPEIVKITGLSKSTVYFHIQNLPLSKTKRLEISLANAARARHIAKKRHEISARLLRRFTKWNNSLVRLIAHLMFDGEIKHGGCIYNNRNSVLLDSVAKDMREIYPLEPRRYFNKCTGVERISYFNVPLGAYVKEKVSELLSNVNDMPLNHKREFLRAFFDDEGCIDFRPERNHRKIRGYQKRSETLHLVQKLLTHFNIESRVILPNEVNITGHANLERFQNEIGFSPGVRINGKRSNSIWKQSLEKREILRRAIESYKPIGYNGVHHSKYR